MSTYRVSAETLTYDLPYNKIKELRSTKLKLVNFLTCRFNQNIGNNFVLIKKQNCLEEL